MSFRNIAIGTGSITARIGAILAPFLIMMVREFIYYVKKLKIVTMHGDDNYQLFAKGEVSINE